MSRRYCIVCAVATALLAALIVLGRPAASLGAEPVSFLRDVAPILKDRCFACHHTKKKGGRLSLASWESLRAGGVHGDPIVEGKPDESELIHVLTAEGARAMPPREHGGPLPSEHIALIRRWIEQGAIRDGDLPATADLLRELRRRWLPPAPPDAYPGTMPITAVAFTPDGRRVVVGGLNELLVYDIEPPRLAARFRIRAERVFALRFLNETDVIIAGGRPGQEGDVSVYRLADDKLEAVLRARLVDADDCVMCLALSRDGARLAAGGCDRVARVWVVPEEAKPWPEPLMIESHADWVVDCVFTPDGAGLLTASRDRTAKVYDLVRQQPAASFTDHAAPVAAVAIHPDGKTLISAGADKKIRWWSADGEVKQRKSLGDHGGELTRLLRHPSQPIVVSVATDRTIRIWAADGKATRVLRDLPYPITAVAISPDGKHLAAGDEAGSVVIIAIDSGVIERRWDAAPGLKR